MYMYVYLVRAYLFLNTHTSVVRLGFFFPTLAKAHPRMVVNSSLFDELPTRLLVDRSDTKQDAWGGNLNVRSDPNFEKANTQRGRG